MDQSVEQLRERARTQELELSFLCFTQEHLVPRHLLRKIPQAILEGAVLARERTNARVGRDRRAF